MSVSSHGDQQQPRFTSTGNSPTFAADLTAVSDYAASVGNRKTGTAADRAALTSADRWPGMEFSQTDTGTTHAYFDAYDASTNPAGTPTAGWYPVSGALPYCEVVRATTDTARTGGVWTIEGSTTDWLAGARRGGFGAWAGSFTIPIGGVYNLHAFLLMQGGNVAGRGMFTKNNAGASTAGCIAESSAGYVWDSTQYNVSALNVRLTAGDVIRFLTFPNTNDTLKGSAALSGQHISVQYIAPPVGA